MRERVDTEKNTQHEHAKKWASNGPALKRADQVARTRRQGTKQEKPQTRDRKSRDKCNGVYDSVLDGF